ncbi:MAG: DUF4118 domain-containing protein [Clostridium sp.]|uniref:DUF4118 domain-containing protein n=1 Tax=Clostridium sp. TaxID=1506 RepID=UPI0030579081
MDIYNDERPNPDALLRKVKEAEGNEYKGRLKIFFGYSAGVGKTYAMLEDAHMLMENGIDVVLGYIEPHTREETMKLIDGIPRISVKQIKYKSIWLKEFDLDEALKRKPQVILVDELAHSNAEGVRNRKRYQDIEELLNSGIDVYTTVNVQHIESLNDTIKGVTRVAVKETVPDYIFDSAEKVELIDIEPDELLKRFEDGKIYKPDRVVTAMNNFFSIQNLSTLREISMRRTADRIYHDNSVKNGTINRSNVSSRILMLLSESPSSARNIRVAARMAEAYHCGWTAIYVEKSDNFNSEKHNKILRDNMTLAEQMGAEVVVLYGSDIVLTVAKYAETAGITNIIIGKRRTRSGLEYLFNDDFEDRLISIIPDVEIHIIPDINNTKPYKKYAKVKENTEVNISWIDTIKTMIIFILTTIACMIINKVGVTGENIALLYILSVVIVSRVTQGYFYGMAASVIGVMCYNIFFVYPYYTMDLMKSTFPITFVIMMLVALITSALTLRIKEQAKSSASREQRTQVLYDISKKLLITRGLENIIKLTNTYITSLFKHSVIFYAEDPAKGEEGILMIRKNQRIDELFMKSKDEKAVASWVFTNKKRAGIGTDTLMGAGAFYMPVISQGKVLGVIGIFCENEILTQDSKIFLQMIVSQVAMALERQRLSDEQRYLMLEAEKKKKDTK